MAHDRDPAPIIPAYDSDEGIVNLPDAGKKHFFDSPANVKKFIAVFFILCGLLVLPDFFYHKHLSFKKGELPQEGWPAFYPLYGLIACVLLVLVAKQLRRILMRREDYYEKP